MRINEILVESQQLDEGPIGSAVGAVGRGIGKAIGGVAKGVGAIAGIPGGIKKAFQKGKQASQDVIGGTDQAAAATTGAEPAPASKPGMMGKLGQFAGDFKAGYQSSSSQQQPAQQAAPAQQPAQQAAPTSAADINAQGPKGTAPAKAQTGAAAQAMQKTAQAIQGANAEKAGQTVYAQVKANIDKLDKKGKQRILQLLQKSVAQPAAQPAAKAAPAAQPAAKAAPAAQPAAAPAAKSEPTAQPAAQPAAKAAPAAKPTADKTEPAAPAKKKAAKRPAAPSQAEIDADRERLMGVTSDSVIRKGRVMSEGIQLFRR